MEDKAVFENFRKNDLGLFYDKMYAGLLMYASKYLGDQHRFLAEDCVQNATFQTWKHIENLPTAGAFKSFLYTCIKNEITSIHRKYSAQNRYVSTLEDEATFINSVIEQETLTYLYNAINKLPEKYRIIIEKNFVEGLKNKEIADLLAISDSSVKKQKAKALEILKEKLSETSGEAAVESILLLILYWHFFK